MNRMLLVALALLLPLAACSEDATDATAGAMQGAPPMPDTTETVSVEPVAARMEDGVQVAEIEAGPMGYQPASVTLRHGVPARLVFTRTVDAACSSQVTVPAFDIAATDLPMNEPVAIEFTPTESGDFTFICGMEMQRGTLVVQS